MRTIQAGKDQIKLFNSICIETAAKCNRTCYFCPNHTTARPDEYMPWNLVEKIAGELRDLKYSGRISPYIYNEPMRDPRLLDFIRLMKKSCPRANIMTNTNGDYIKDEQSVERLFEAGLDSLVINVYAAKDHTPLGISLANTRYDRFIQMFAHRIVSKQSPYLNRGVVQVLRKYGDHFEGGHKRTNRSGNIEWIAPSITEPLQKGCVRPWRVANINWNGDLILCCNDFHGEETFGNANTHTIAQMWNDMRLHQIRADLQQKNRTTVPLCAKCDFNGGAYLHMLEKVAML